MNVSSEYYRKGIRLIVWELSLWRRIVLLLPLLGFGWLVWLACKILLFYHTDSKEIWFLIGTSFVFLLFLFGNDAAQFSRLVFFDDEVLHCYRRIDGKRKKWLFARYEDVKRVRIARNSLQFLGGYEISFYDSDGEFMFTLADCLSRRKKDCVIKFLKTKIDPARFEVIR